MKSNKNSGSDILWGELPPRESFKQEVITPDIIENVWRQVMDETSVDCDYPTDNQTEFVQLPAGDVRVFNIINLHQCLRELASDSPTGNVAQILSDVPHENQKSENPFGFLELREERLMFENPLTNCNLATRTVRHILRHTVIVLLAHIGFERSSDIAIETLADVASHFLRRMTLLLKIATERDERGFPDAVERVLLETGVGGVVALHDYYQEFVLRYKVRLERKVENLLEEQRRCEDNSANARMETEEAGKLHFEELDEFGNVYKEVPTLQLIDPEMSFTPSLDAGFQMLHSLEQDQLNNLENEQEDEGTEISVSPGTGHRGCVSAEKRKKIERKSSNSVS